MSAERPYDWPKTEGTLTAAVLMDYASWLFPRLKLEWEAPGVIKRKTTLQKVGDEAQTKKPYQFRKTKGWLNLQRDMRPFARYVLAELKKWSDRKPYLPTRREGPAMMDDLKDFDAHVQLLIKAKKEEQSRQKP